MVRKPVEEVDGDRHQKSIDELLAEQLLAVQRAMAFNEEIAKRLKGEQQEAARMAVRPRSKPLPPPWKGVAVALSEPLLSKPKIDIEKPSLGVRARAESNVHTKEELEKYVEQALGKEEEYNVESLYSETGIWQAVAKSNRFQDLALIVIVLNSIWISIDTDFNNAEVLSQAAWPFQVVENLFCAFFTFEITVRFLAFKYRSKAFTDGWFVFDSVLVSFMVLETWVVTAMVAVMGTNSGSAAQGVGHSSIFRMFRLLRLTRVTRMARVLRSLPELVVLVRGMMMGMRSVVATFGLLMALVYIYAVILTQLLKGSDSDLQSSFSGVMVSMNTLLMQGIFSDQAQFFGQMLDEGLLFYTIFMMFMLTGAFTVMNMLIGVLCDVMSNVSDDQKDDWAVNQLKAQIEKLIAEVDVDGDMMVSQAEFAHMLQSKEALKSLEDVEVDVMALVHYADFIFRESSDMPIPEFTDAVLQFRATTPACMKDLVEMRHFITKELAALEFRLCRSP